MRETSLGLDICSKAEMARADGRQEEIFKETTACRSRYYGRPT
jgi:hypothetical protein